MLLFVIASVGARPLRAVSIYDPRTLAQVVADSEYVVVGVVKDAFALDKNGKEIKSGNPESGPGSDVQLGVEILVAPNGILKSRGPDLGSTIKVYCGFGILHLDDLKELQGQQFVILLRRHDGRFYGTDYGFCGAGLRFSKQRKEIEAALSSEGH